MDQVTDAISGPMADRVTDPVGHSPRDPLRVRWLGRVPYREAYALQRALSNVLLESWAAGLPTVSGVDPDGLVTRERIGRFAPDFATLVEAVQGYMSDPSTRREAGRRARLYALRAHSPEVVLGILRGTLDPLLGARRGPRS